MKPEFPALNYTYKDWNKIQDGVLIYDLYYYGYKLDFFEDFYLNHTLIDSAGKQWKIIGIERPKSFFRRLFRFLPNVYKCNMTVIHMEERVDFKLVKQYFLDKVTATFDSGTTEEWRRKIKSSYNYKSLFS